MDTTVRGVPERHARRLAVVCVVVLTALTACSGDPTQPLGGDWSRWEPARPTVAARLPRYVPERLPPGVVPLDRESFEPEVLEPTFRALVARLEDGGLATPIVVLVRRAPKPRAPGRLPSRNVDIAGTQGSLRATPLGTTVRWWTNGFDAIVTGAPDLEDAVVGVARGLRLAPGGNPGEITVGEVPDGFRLVDASVSPRTRLRATTLRFRSARAGAPELTISAQRATGFDPLLSAVPVHADAVMARRIRVRGADAVMRGSTETGIFDMQESRMITITWLEHPNVLVSVSGVGRNLEIKTVRQVAEGLRRITPDEWNERYRPR